MADETSEKVAPAYVPTATLFNFINSLRETGLPSQVNKSVMTNLSYTTQAQLLASMRYLGLIDTEGRPQAILSRLVEADDKARAPIVEEILRARYSFVFDNLDLSRVTTEELEKQFRQEGISGSTVERAVGFFRGAAEMAGLTLSPHLKKRSSPTGAPRKARSKKRPKVDQTTTTDKQQTVVSTGYQDKLLDKFPPFDPGWEDDIKKLWFAGFKQFQEALSNPTSAKNEDDGP
jgi:hypothetical protein